MHHRLVLVLTAWLGIAGIACASDQGGASFSTQGFGQPTAADTGDASGIPSAPIVTGGGGGFDSAVPSGGGGFDSQVAAVTVNPTAAQPPRTR